jgi:hypothetical protein
MVMVDLGGFMMSFRLRESDCKIIECIAEYNILTVPQITAIFQKNKQVLRRRFRELKRQGLVNMTNREFGRTRGRPESLLGSTERGLDILKEKGIIDRDIPYESVSPVSIRRVDHQILLNWFRIHLNQIERVLPRLSVRFLAYNSPFLPRQPDGRTIISDSSPIGHRSVREIRKSSIISGISRALDISDIKKYSTLHVYMDFVYFSSRKQSGDWQLYVN